jgi:hypothetical protein
LYIFYKLKHILILCCRKNTPHPLLRSGLSHKGRGNTLHFPIYSTAPPQAGEGKIPLHYPSYFPSPVYGEPSSPTLSRLRERGSKFADDIIGARRAGEGISGKDSLNSRVGWAEQREAQQWRERAFFYTTNLPGHYCTSRKNKQRGQSLKFLCI